MKKKVYLSVLFMIILLCGACKGVNAEETVGVFVSSQEQNNDEYNEAYNYLVSKGADVEFLNACTPEQIVRMYENIYGKDCEFSGYITETVIVENAAQSRGGISQNMLYLTLGAWVEKSDSYIKGITLEGAYLWKKPPYIKLTDAITLNWDSSLFVRDGFYAQCAYYVASNFIETNFYTRPDTAASGGLGLYVPIKKAYADSYAYDVSGGISVHFLPKKSMISTGQFTSFELNYAHQIIGTGISLGITGPGVIFSGGSYDWASAIYNVPL